MVLLLLISSVVSGAPTISTAATTSSNVGSYTITSAANNLSAANYQFSYVNGSLTINKAPLTVTGASTTVTYNSAVQINNDATITGGKLFDPFTVTGYATGTNAATYNDTLSVTSPAIGNYNVTYVNGSLKINKAPLTVTGATTSLTYSAGVQTNNTATITGRQGSDTISVSGYATGTNVGTYNEILSVSSSALTNYNVTINNGSLTITKASLTVTGVTTSVTYNGVAQTNNAATITGRQGSDVISVSGYSSGTNAGTYNDILSVSSSALTNYNVTINNGSLIINPKTLTIGTTTVNNKVYDGTTAATVNTLGTVSGLVGNESVSVATSTANFSTKNVGTGLSVTVSYTLQNGNGAKGGFASNYTLANTTTTANITAKALTISNLTVTDKVYDGTTSATLNKSSATLVGVITGDAVSLNTTNASGTYASANAANGIAVTVTGNSISGTESGNYTLTQPSLS
ncbi:MAG: hypothetical protein EBV74_03825, partial [Alphaproteobacteria bacterium]|nr:hypothetical protein [Candidatus Fonsibacter sp. PEL55]